MGQKLSYEQALAMIAKRNTRKRQGHHEEDLQMSCVRWFELAHPDLARLLHHSPNGGRRDAREAGRFKAMGTRAGFPDLILLVPSHGHPYLCIEMKYGAGRQTERQREYQRAVEAQGAKYVVVRSAMEFAEIINNYLP